MKQLAIDNIYAIKFEFIYQKYKYKTGVRFSCDQCDKTFYDKEHLKKHTSYVHTGKVSIGVFI